MDISRKALGSLRIALLIVLLLLILPMVMAIGQRGTGPFEKVVLSAATVGLLCLALPVHRIGRRA